MNLQIGKRYSFSPWCGVHLKPGKHYYDGILESVDDHWAYLVCRNGEFLKRMSFLIRKSLRNKSYLTKIKKFDIIYIES